MMMPNGMTGLDLGIRLRQDKPCLKIVLVSGFSSDIIKERGKELPNICFLSKPYEPDSLARMIRDVLDGVTSTTRLSNLQPSVG
jgi:CheY-like chemotaxis protein